MSLRSMIEAFAERQLHKQAIMIAGRAEVRRRGQCPECRRILTKHARGMYRCDHCRNEKEEL